ncbi:hypothetical protein [Methylocapsa aurea]|uniref:hypothetical protein n=1 Tax=Methylocapsa aurea TaxID=663610 RepID=UPI0012EBFD37|nr:hypothetical protein [Methylocapsa aurea]
MPNEPIPAADTGLPYLHEVTAPNHHQLINQLSARVESQINEARQGLRCEFCSACQFRSCRQAAFLRWREFLRRLGSALAEGDAAILHRSKSMT